MIEQNEDEVDDFSYNADDEPLREPTNSMQQM